MSRHENKSLLIKGGQLIDPAAKMNAPMDVLLREGRVAEVAPPNKIRGSADDKFDACASPARSTKKPLHRERAPPPWAALPRSAPCPTPRPW
jgi:hypothetical protein